MMAGSTYQAERGQSGRTVNGQTCINLLRTEGGAVAKVGLACSRVIESVALGPVKEVQTEKTGLRSEEAVTSGRRPEEAVTSRHLKPEEAGTWSEEAVTS